jgi:lysozyme
VTNKKKILIVGGVVFLLFFLKNKAMAALDIAEKIIRKWETGNDVKKYLTAYKDIAGVWTIGFGSIRNHDQNRPVRQGDVIDEPTAVRWMKIEMGAKLNSVKKLIKVPVNANEEAALLSLTYNIGLGAFGDSTLLKLLNANAPRLQVADQFLVWNKYTDPVTRKKLVSIGLDNRRKNERDLFLRKI